MTQRGRGYNMYTSGHLESVGSIPIDSLTAGEVIEIHTKRSVYTCTMKDLAGFATIRGTNPKYRGPYEGHLVGVQDEFGTHRGVLRPGGRLRVNLDRGNPVPETMVTGRIMRIVVNGSLVLANFGAVH